MFGGYLPGYMILEFHGFVCRRDPDHLTARAHIDGELFAKGLFRRHQEARLFFNYTSDMVRQPAVGVRNVRSAFHHEDFCIFVQPAQARRTRCAASHTTDDNDFDILGFTFGCHY